MSLTAQQVVDQARMRHFAFSTLQLTDGAVLRAIESRQRTLVLRYGGALGGLINRTVMIAVQFTGTLVGAQQLYTEDGTPRVDEAGQPIMVPTSITTVDDGWAVQLNDAGIPYVDFAFTPIATDPFGSNGGTPGFPLPDDFIKLIQLTCTYGDGRVRPVDVVQEIARLDRTRISVPTTFISGNRLVPVRPLAQGNAGDTWSGDIQSITLSYVAVPTLSTLADELVMPVVFAEPLIAGVAEFLAMAVGEQMSEANRIRFSEAARRAEEALQEYAVDVVGSALRRSVVYRG